MLPSLGMGRWTAATTPDPEPTVEEVAVRYGVGGVAAIFAVAGGLALAFAWEDMRRARRRRRPA